MRKENPAGVALATSAAIETLTANGIPAETIERIRRSVPDNISEEAWISPAVLSGVMRLVEGLLVAMTGTIIWAAYVQEVSLNRPPTLFLSSASWHLQSR